jgi:hypothetical protein
VEIHPHEGGGEADVPGQAFFCIPVHKSRVSVGGIKDVFGVSGPPSEMVDVPDAGCEVAEQHTHSLPLPMVGKQLHDDGACALLNK